MKKIMLTALALIASVATHAQAGESRFRLLCQSPDGQYFIVANIDLAAKTVNGIPAHINDTSIAWVTPKTKHEISRLTGVYKAQTEGFIPTGSGPVISCAKAPTPKF